MAEEAGSPTEGVPPRMRTGISFRRLGSGPAPVQALRDETTGGLARLFVIAAVAVFANVLSLGRTGDATGALSAANVEHNLLNTAGYAAVLVVVLPLLIVRRAALVPIIANAKLFWLFMAIAFASVFWAVDPIQAAHRLAQLSAPVLVALYASSRFDPATTIRLTGITYILMLIASAAVAVLLPRVGVIQPDPGAPVDLTESSQLVGDWSGIVGHKNVLGFITLANALVFAWRIIVEKERRWLLAAALLFGMFVTWKTHSATSTLLVGMTVITYLAARLCLAIPKLAALVLSVVVAMAGAVLLLSLLMPQEMTALVGKDATLTGRVPIWIDLVEHAIPARPWLGYGFNTFFVFNNPAYVRLVDIVHWRTPHAHNGYLNLAVELGVPAALIATFIVLRVIVGSFHVVLHEGNGWALYLLVFSLILVVLNLVESTLLRGGDSWTFTLAFGYFALARRRGELQRSAPPPRGALRFGPQHNFDAAD